MPDAGLLALFVAGLVGGGHCLGMCGGVVTAFTLQLPPGPRWPYLLGFNAGRLAGYALIGAIAGTLGSLPGLLALDPIKTVLAILADLLLVAMGLYIAGWAGWFTRLEKLGVPIWRRIQPWLRRWLPIRRGWHTLVVGALWGWLPCGLVYSASLSSMASSSTEMGAAMMLAFGLGTLPNLLAMGIAAESLRRALAQVWLRRILGLGLVATGCARLAFQL
ncbi:sulfite exporter TauE/SafE family protein [Chitiniphilus purpureus]|uniref:Sulfite exporter TauE/SafE family protein n=1 Tax=Chitiniphilus purpureus TaxID=2981137 RepID=A0ABY6DTY0_9NEIS|nr:sulfite exporter TauE/SafE family protein [Chitiniphilus sp. CD1]UXY17183.1 sulfite exporter TauE/SafE family protein [Chitiniphilus sp. CD1]